MYDSDVRMVLQLHKVGILKFPWISSKKKCWIISIYVYISEVDVSALV